MGKLIYILDIYILMYIYIYLGSQSPPLIMYFNKKK